MCTTTRVMGAGDGVTLGRAVADGTGVYVGRRVAVGRGVADGAGVALGGGTGVADDAAAGAELRVPVASGTFVGTDVAPAPVMSVAAICAVCCPGRDATEVGVPVSAEEQPHSKTVRSAITLITVRIRF